jgi:hypothetical protein
MPSPSSNNDLFPLDFLTFSNFDTSPLPNAGSTPNQSMTATNGAMEKDGSTPSNGQGHTMDFDLSLSQFQQQMGETSGEGRGHSASTSGSRRGSVDLKRVGRKRASVSSLSGMSSHGHAQGQGQGMEVDNHTQNQNQIQDFQAMLDAATAGESSNEQNNYDQAQAGLLQQQVCHVPLISDQRSYTYFVLSSNIYICNPR